MALSSHSINREWKVKEKESKNSAVASRQWKANAARWTGHINANVNQIFARTVACAIFVCIVCFFSFSLFVSIGMVLIIRLQSLYGFIESVLFLLVFYYCATNVTAAILIRYVLCIWLHFLICWSWLANEMCTHRIQNVKTGGILFILKECACFIVSSRHTEVNENVIF